MKRLNPTCLRDAAEARGCRPVRAWAGGATVAGLLLAACGDGAPVDPPPPAPTWILLVPDSLRFTYLGERVRAQVRVQRVPDLVGGTEVNWSSTDAAVFTVDAEGELTARANGEAALVAEVKGLRDTARVRVRQEAARIEVVAGGGQRGPAGLELLDPVQVRMTDAGGALLAVRPFVDFDASAHGGRAWRGVVVRDPKPYEAWAKWALGPAPGPQSLVVTVLHGSATAEIGAVALHPDSVVALLAAHSGEGQGALPGEALAEPVMVAALDTLGRRLPGATVRFEPAAGHGSADPAEAASDSMGLAATVWTLGEAPGRQTLVASAGGGASVDVHALVQSDEGVCARTPALAEEIVQEVGAASCAEVTEGDLEAITELVLRNLGIRRLRNGDFAGLTNLTRLLVFQNPLSELSPGTFEGLHDLNSLVLANNGLTELRPGLFAGLPKLKWLVLTYNKLPVLPPGIFDDLPSLEHLSLYHNELTELPPGIFANLGNLRDLRLQRNGLTELPPGIFAGLYDLERLYLHGNSLHALRPDVFADLDRLGQLGLHENDLAVLQPGLFDGLSEVTLLRLEHNSLASLPPEIFEGLESLQMLNLAANDLAELPAGIFDGLRSLDTLNLWSNGLVAIPRGAFAELASLRWLNLSRNELSELPHGVFAGLRQLSYVDGWGNPGAPFPVAMAFERTDAQVLAPGPASLVSRVPAGAPFALRIRVSVQQGTASAGWLEVAAGDTVSRPMVVGQPSGSDRAVHVSFGLPPPLPHTRGFEVMTGEPMVLFAESDNRTPEVAEPVPAYWMSEGSAALPLELASYFSDPDGDSLFYGVESGDGGVAGGSVLDGVLWIEPRGEGETTLEVTAADPGGLMASQAMALQVAPAPDPDRFNIEVIVGPGLSERHLAEIRRAADRWEEVVVGDLPDVRIDGHLDGCNTDRRLAGVIDDLVVGVRVDRISNRSGAAVCRSREGGLALEGRVHLGGRFFEPEFDSWDLFYRVVLHEIGHALGIGSGLAWDRAARRGGSDPHFPGLQAVEAFNAAGGSAYAGSRVPLHRSELFHWRNQPVSGEIMSGWFLGYSLSAITVQALADLGYVVDVTKADPYTLPGAGSVAPGGAASDGEDGSAWPDFEFMDDVIRGPVMVVDSTGKVVRVIGN